MSRLEKKCFWGSALLHGLLCLVLLLGSAFFMKNTPPDNLPILEVIPSKVVDDLLFGGGGMPKVAAPTPSRPPVAQAPPKAAPEPQKSEPRPEKSPARTEPKHDVETLKDPDAPPISVKPKNKKPDTTEKETGKSKNQIELALSPVKRPNQARLQAEADARAETKRLKAEQAARADAIRQSVSHLQEGLSTGTTIEMPVGPGGGEAYANYGQVVKSIYDQAWIAPEEISNDVSAVLVKVVVARNGNIISASVTRRSGVGPVDRSVQQALDRVRSLPAFPEGAKEAQRTYNINFNLKTKRHLDG